MGSRWLDRARAAVPLVVRDSCFEPVLADLQWSWALRRSRTPGWARPFLYLSFFAQLWVAVFQCRRLSQSPSSSRNTMMQGAFIRTVVHAGRRLLRQPRFTAAMALTLALGLGANVTVFTFVDSFLIAALPVPDADRLVRVAEARDGERGVTAYPNYRDVRDSASAALDLAAHVQTEAQLGTGDGARVATVELVSGNYFRVMQVVPQRGRLLDDNDNRAELAHAVVVVSDRYWRLHLGAAPDVVGRTLTINGATFEVVGVAPAGFHGTFAAHHVDVWTPIVMQGWVRPRGLSVERRTWGWLWMIGRLRDDVTFAQAEQSVRHAVDELNRAFPPGRPEDGVSFEVHEASALSESDASGLRPLLQAALAFTALLFLATCANLGGILHSRLAARTRELAIRQSLGAGRRHLAVEWIVECVLLALLGGAAALLVAIGASRALGLLDIPSELVGQVSLDAVVGWRVVLYTFGVSVVGALLFGGGTAWRAARDTPLTALKAEGGTQAGGARAARGRRLTVVLQVASSVVLLLIASLLGASLSRQINADPGFDAERLGLMSISMQRQRVPASDWAALTERALATARATPGVLAVATAMRPPLGLGEDVQSVQIPGYTPPDGQPTVTVDFNLVTAGYFDVLGLSFRAGGPWPDTVSASPAVVINDTMATRFWPGGDAVGRAIVVGSIQGVVAGVVADSAYYEVGEAPRPMMYLPAELQPQGNFAFLLRAGGDPATAAADVARALAAADSRLAPADVMSFADLRRVPLFPARLLAAAALMFSAISLLLTIVGLYGVIAASVGERTREIGVRLALGATPSTVQGAVIREALWLAAVGAALGGVAGYGAALALRGWLFTVAPFDPAVYASVLAVIAAVAVASAWLPARGAARVDPVSILR
jgi:predicted permease